MQYENLTLDEIAKNIKESENSKLKDFLKNYGVSVSELKLFENGKEVTTDIIEFDGQNADDNDDEDTDIFLCVRNFYYTKYTFLIRYMVLFFLKNII